VNIDVEKNDQQSDGKFGNSIQACSKTWVCSEIGHLKNLGRKHGRWKKTSVGERPYFSVFFPSFSREGSLVQKNERLEAQMNEPARNNEKVDDFFKIHNIKYTFYFVKIEIASKSEVLIKNCEHRC
jgi:hypothetical protein